jgi:hypothetical protein
LLRTPLLLRPLLLFLSLLIVSLALLLVSLPHFFLLRPPVVILHTAQRVLQEALVGALTLHGALHPGSNSQACSNERIKVVWAAAQESFIWPDCGGRG